MDYNLESDCVVRGHHIYKTVGGHLMEKSMHNFLFLDGAASTSIHCIASAISEQFTSWPINCSLLLFLVSSAIG